MKLKNKFWKKKSGNDFFNSNDIAKKINWMLGSNFYTLEKFREESQKEQLKLLRLMAKIEGIKIRKSDLKQMVFFINGDFNFKIKTSANLWEFAFSLKPAEKIIAAIFMFVEMIASLRTYWTDRFEVLRC